MALPLGTHGGTAVYCTVLHKWHMPLQYTRTEQYLRM